jgi:hypothetical protein
VGVWVDFIYVANLRGYFGAFNDCERTRCSKMPILSFIVAVVDQTELLSMLSSKRVMPSHEVSNDCHIARV